MAFKDKMAPIVVLVVDDEPMIRMDVSDYIASPEIVPIEACNADEALRILSERDDIDVVFTDVNMPGSMDGLQLAARVRALSKNIGLIIASGMVRVVRSELPDQALFFEKPYDLHKIASSIKTLARVA